MSLVRFETNPPYAEFLGIDIVRREVDGVEAHLPFKPELQNRKGDVHGGAIASLIDMSLGAASYADLGTSAAASTLSITVNYLNAAKGDLRCFARCVRRGRSIRFVEAEVLDDKDEVVAKAVATFKVFPGKPAE
ncbi:phenylacetic acid degradation protein [Nitratireductor aestuarii]|uniref:Phenylacetic acid degradation protein n=1 Tax=Nitratireductor aestuarii TaxID=1735103 RepID=A0A916W3F4_9HYPH|nr:PaaI family thioesterase [Nitratireductor aestuarii]GGA62826.1 phenylacetic acid degradation protein [Nitratireductor aestuarii]